MEKIRNRERGKGGSKCGKQHRALEWKKKTNSQHCWPSSSVSLHTEKGMSLELSSSKVNNSFSEHKKYHVSWELRVGRTKQKGKIYANRSREQKKRNKGEIMALLMHITALQAA